MAFHAVLDEALHRPPAGGFPSFWSRFMRHVGTRREQALSDVPTGALLAEGARFNEAVHRLAAASGVAKGIYRFKTHEEANRHALDSLVRGMARVAGGRS